VENRRAQITRGISNCRRFRLFICDMRTPFLALAAVIALGFTAGAAGPHPSLPPPVVPECLGVNIHFTDPKPGEMEMLAAAGFKWVRMDFSWSSTERKRGEYDFSAYDRLVANLDKHKLRAVFILDYGNPLYAEPGEKQPFTSRANTPGFREAFAKWAVAAVSHFKGRGYLWEMWNEPNHDHFWKPKTNVDDYAALAKATGEALHAAGLTTGDTGKDVKMVRSRPGNPSSPVLPVSPVVQSGECFIGPATSTIDLPFLETCFKAGLLEYWDAVSVHPYRQSAPETVEDEYRAVRLLIRKYAPKDKTIPIISGEWGYSTQYPAFAGKDAAARDDQQAKWLARMFLTNIANDVALSIWYDWHDDGTNPTEPEHHFGVVAHEYHPGRDPVYDPKPAYTAMKTMTEQLGGFRFNKSLAFKGQLSGMDHVTLFEGAGEVRLAAWSHGDTGNLVELPADNDDVTVVKKDGTKSVQTANQPGHRIGLQYALEPDPAYLRFRKPNEALQIAAAVNRLPLEWMFDTPGRSPELRIGFRNIGSNPLSARFGTPDSFRPLLVCPPSDMKAQWVAKGAQFERRFAAHAKSRLPNGEALLLGIEIAPTLDSHIHENVPIYQLVRVAPSLPIRVSRLPGPAEEVIVKIENPSGLPWSGAIQALSQGWKGGHKGVSGKVSLTLPKDQAAVVARIPITKEPDRDISWTVVSAIALIAADGSVSQVPLPLTRIVKLEVSNVEVLPDGDSKAEAIPTTSAEPPSEGAVGEGVPVLRLNYRFSADRKFFRVINPSWPPPGEKDLIQSPKFFGLWIYGDGQGCRPRIRFMDSTEQVFQSSGPKITWKGWRQVFFAMESTNEKPLERWGGEDDGKIHYPIEFDSIFLLDNVSRQPVEGEIYLSAPTLIY
jgi:hypothetical protein